MTKTSRVTISGIAAFSGLGRTLSEMRACIANGKTAFRALYELYPDAPESWRNVFACWSDERNLFSSRKYSPAAQLAIFLAKEAFKNAGSLPNSRAEMGIFVGSSRGNIAGWIDPWGDRRPISLMSASNSLLSEIATAVSIEFGISGPFHILSNGCASGLDALGLASLMIQVGKIQSALVLGIDLPITPSILETYAKTGMLAKKFINNPYSPKTNGLLPGEGGAAFILEKSDSKNGLKITDWDSNSDASHPISMPADAPQLTKLLTQAFQSTQTKFPGLCPHLCPHASGTSNNAQGEITAISNAFKTTFANAAPKNRPHLLAIKPTIGHTIGASGTIETAILCEFLRHGELPGNLPDLTAPNIPFQFYKNTIPYDGLPIVKSASSMGGHNSILILEN